MASFTQISHSLSLFNKITPSPSSSSSTLNLQSCFVPKRLNFQHKVSFFNRIAGMPLRKAAAAVVVSVTMTDTTAEKSKKRYPGEAKGFVEEMRFVAMKLHTREQAREGEKEVEQPEEKAVRKWEPTVEGYLRFLVDSKLVYDTLEGIVEKAAFPFYAEFKNTGLERSASLAKDLEWFREQGYTIPEPSSPGVTYAEYLKELSENDPQAFICHFYNVYFAHTAGGRMIGKKVAEMILNKKELEFYKWDGDLSVLLQNVRDKLNKVAELDQRREGPLFGRNGKILQVLGGYPSFGIILTCLINEAVRKEPLSRERLLRSVDWRVVLKNACLVVQLGENLCLALYEMEFLVR